MSKVGTLCIVALDIIEYSKKSAALKREIKNQFDDLIQLAIKDIPESNYHIAYTEQGAVIACTGPSDEALEDALFISLTVRDEILKNNIDSLKPWYVQFGIDLGSGKVGGQSTGLQTVSEEGIDKASLIMSYANPNQILVSRAYYEKAVTLSDDILKMFEQYDLHTHEEEIYAVRPYKSQAEVEEAAAILASQSSTKKPSPSLGQILGGVNWMYLSVGLFMLAGFFVLSQKLLTPIEPMLETEESIQTEGMSQGLNQSVQTLDLTAQNEAESQLSSDEETTNKVEQQAKAAKAAEKSATKKIANNKPKVVKKTLVEKTASETPPEVKENTALAVNPPVASSNAKSEPASDKSGWDAFKESIKQGAEPECTQAEIALNQCDK